MDSTTASLVDYVLEARFDALPEASVEASKTRLLDSLACVAAGFHHPISVAACRLAGRYPTDGGTTLLGSPLKVAPEMAAFANGTMLRVLDLSDMYRTKSGGHPSDTIAGVLAAAELGACDGRSLLTSIAIAYEVYCSGCDAFDFNSKGWDQPVYGVVATALATGYLLGLGREQLGHAVSLALVPNMAMYQTRHGELSSWKGSAGANGARNGVFAALLAQAGFTGPEAPIEGKHGLWDAVGRFEWRLLASQPPQRITRTHIKCFPICYHGQSAVWAALSIRDRVQIEQIKAIRIDTHRTAVDLMAGSTSRWAPATAETADHSLPYVVARAFLDGEINEEAFRLDALRHPQVLSLMACTKVHEDEKMSAMFPDYSPCRITVSLADGAQVQGEVKHPKGHEQYPMTPEEIDHKVISLFEPYGGLEQARALIEIVRHADQVDDVTRIFVPFRKNEVRP